MDFHAFMYVTTGRRRELERGNSAAKADGTKRIRSSFANSLATAPSVRVHDRALRILLEMDADPVTLAGYQSSV